MTLLYVFALVFAVTGGVIGILQRSIAVALVAASAALLAWPHVF